MRGVGEQRKGPGEEADDDLAGHEDPDQAEREREPAPVGIRGHTVSVATVPMPVVPMVIVPMVVVLLTTKLVVTDVLVVMTLGVAPAHGKRPLVTRNLDVCAMPHMSPPYSPIATHAGGNGDTPGRRLTERRLRLELRVTVVVRYRGSILNLEELPSWRTVARGAWPCTARRSRPA
nr:hypothetical protein GCM10020063_039330 [Dactylosporangium thailandense]